MKSMEIFILITFCLFHMSFAMPYSTIERKSLNYYPSNNFHIIGQSLEEHMKMTNDTKVLHADKGITTQIFLRDFANYKMLFKNAKDVKLQDNTLIYHIPLGFSFEMKANYILTYYILPLSGVFSLKMTAEDVEYKLDIKEKTIVPTMTAKWKFEVFDISNSVALALNARPIIEAAGVSVASYFNNIIDKILESDVSHFYEGYFGDSNYYIHFPYHHNASITIQHKFDKLSPSSINDPLLIASYDEKYDPVPSIKSKYDDDPYLRCITYDVNSIANILQWEIHLTNNLILTHDMIPAKSLFQLDTKSSARILPDLLQLYEDSKLQISFTGRKTDLSAKYCRHHEAIEIEGMEFTATVSLAQEKIPLFRTTFNTSAHFKPSFVADPEDSKRLFLKFSTLDADAVVISNELLWENEYAIFNENAVAGYINDFLKNYWVKYTNDDIVGTGLLLSFGFPINKEKIKYGTESTKEFKVYLFDS